MKADDRDISNQRGKNNREIRNHRTWKFGREYVTVIGPFQLANSFKQTKKTAYEIWLRDSWSGAQNSVVPTQWIKKIKIMKLTIRTPSTV